MGRGEVLLLSGQSVRPAQCCTQWTLDMKRWNSLFFSLAGVQEVMPSSLEVGTCRKTSSREEGRGKQRHKNPQFAPCPCAAEGGSEFAILDAGLMSP